MFRLTILVAALLLALPTWAAEQGKMPNVLSLEDVIGPPATSVMPPKWELSTSKFVRVCRGASQFEEFCFGYILGVADLHRYVEPGPLYCIPDGIKSDALKVAVLGEIRDAEVHPYDSAVKTILAALVVAYPCTRE